MKNPKYILFVTLVTLALSSLVAAQNRERFGISAKAGVVNAVVGRVMVTREGQQPQLLTQTEDVTAMDVVSTGSSSNAEVLLNPGSYLRLAENSEFKFENVSLDNLQLRLMKGSAIIEATGVADMNVGIKVATPHGEFTIIRSGVYRINVQTDSSELMVRKGRASFGPNKTDAVKGGNSVAIGNGFVSQGKLPKDKDAFELWSKQRAEFLAKANERLSRRALSNYLSDFNSWDSWYWGPRRLGLWTFSPRFGCYTFLPFYYGWASPYGHGYGTFYWRGGGYWTSNPIIVNNNPVPSITGVPPSGSSIPTSGGAIPSPGAFGSPSSPRSTNAAPRDPDSGGRIPTRNPEP